MTQCNCKNTDELRIVRGNAFSMEINIEARRLDGTLVEDFDLSQAEATLKVVYYDQKTVKTFSVVGNSAIIGFDNTMPLGWYGLEMTGTYNAAPWRWCVTKVFQIVETNEKANIPTWTFLTDDTYVVDGVLTLMSGDVYQADWDETNIYSPSYIKNKPDVVLHPEFNQTVQRIDRDIDDEETRAKGAEQTLQEHIDAEALARGNADTTLQGNIDDEETRAKGVEQGLDGRLTTAEGDIDTIEGKIPASASSQNQLVDRNQMNSSISTATATYRGAYNLVSDLELTVASTEQQITAALATKMTALGITPDNNDYCFVQVPTSDATPTEIARVDRYKYNGTAWAFEFSLNNSGFTAAQWAALNSGITSGLVTKLSDLPTNSELTTLLGGKADKVSGATAGNFAGLDGNGNLTDSGKKASDFATAAQGTKADEAAPQSTTYTKTEVDGLVDDEETRAKGVEQGLDGRLTTAEGDIDTIEGKIPAAASSQNQLVDQNQMNSSISTATATYRGAYNLVSDLELTTVATEQQIAAALATKMTALGITPDNNDYCFVQIPTADATPTEIARVDRYKYNGTAWAFEFSLNNSGFTAAQWAALNSGITSGLVTKLSDLPTNSELTTLLNGKADKVSGATAGNFAGLDGNGNLTDSGKKASDFATAAQGTKADEAAPQSTTYTKTEVDGLVDDEETRAKGVEQGLDGRLTTAEGDIDTIEGKIPAAASSQNQLVDQNQMNSSISTATATYRGAYNLVSDLELTTAATEQQIAAALATKMTALGITPDNNDYCFVQVPTADATPTEIARVDRYKFNGTAWAFEFSLNNSGFTAAQWAALNSGITSGLVTKLSDLPTNSELTTLLNGKADKVSGATAGNFAGLDGNGNLTDSGKKASDFATAAQGTKADEAAPQSTTYTKTEVDGLVDDEETRAKGVEQGLDGRLTTAEGDIDTIEGKIPAAASSQNQLVDQNQMNSSISTATATYRGAYNLVSDLELTVAATEQQIAAALATKMTALGITPDNNDYCFVQVPTADATPTEIARVDRYKFNGTAWVFEFSLNNSGFTAAQWAALNSGITSGLVTKLSDLPTNSELTTLLGGKADKSTTVTNVSFNSSTNKIQQTINGQTTDVCSIAQGGYRIIENNTTGIDELTPVGGATITDDNTNGLDILTF